jgi:hypothetical protein
VGVGWICVCQGNGKRIGRAKCIERDLSWCEVLEGALYT